MDEVVHQLETALARPIPDRGSLSTSVQLATRGRRDMWLLRRRNVSYIDRKLNLLEAPSTRWPFELRHYHLAIYHEATLLVAHRWRW